MYEFFFIHGEGPSNGVCEWMRAFVVHLLSPALWDPVNYSTPVSSVLH